MNAWKQGVLAGLVVVSAIPIATQQVADPAFTPVIGKPQYETGRGPRVLIDAAHLNFHTADEGYAPFTRAPLPNLPAFTAAEIPS